MAHIQEPNSKLWRPESTHELADSQKMFIDNIVQQEANFTELFNKVDSAQGNLKQMTNPNMLVNPNFKVNQRGNTVYNGAVWTADRWFSNNAKNTVELTNDGIKITMTGASFFVQNMEVLPKGTYTISAEVYKAGDSLTLMVAGVSSWLVSLANVGVVSATFTVDEDRTGVGIGIFGNTASEAALGTSYVKWIKLEKGSVATPFITPDPWSEMLKCGTPNDGDGAVYGYFKRVLESDSVTGIGKSSSATLASLFPLVRTSTVKHFFYTNGLPSDFPAAYTAVSSLFNYAMVTVKRSGDIAFYTVEGVYSSGTPFVIEGFYQYSVNKFYWKNISDSSSVGTPVANATVE